MWWRWWGSLKFLWCWTTKPFRWDPRRASFLEPPLIDDGFGSRESRWDFCESLERWTPFVWALLRARQLPEIRRLREICGENYRKKFIGKFVAKIMTRIYAKGHQKPIRKVQIFSFESSALKTYWKWFFVILQTKIHVYQLMGKRWKFITKASSISSGLLEGEISRYLTKIINDRWLNLRWT